MRNRSVIDISALCLGLAAVAAGCTVPPPESTAPPIAAPEPATNPGTSDPATGTPPTSVPEMRGAELTEVPSPEGGMAAKVTLSGPETSIMAECVQQGFKPFFYTAVGENWVGCESAPNAAVGPAVDRPITLSQTPSPAGGIVQKLSLPGPQLAAVVACSQTGFVPFVYDAEGFSWIGCRSN